MQPGRGGGGGVLGSIFSGYVLLASQNPYPIIVYSVANYRPHLSHFWAKCNFRDPKLVTFCLCLYLNYRAFQVGHPKMN